MAINASPSTALSYGLTQDASCLVTVRDCFRSSIRQTFQLAMTSAHNGFGVPFIFCTEQLEEVCLVQYPSSLCVFLLHNACQAQARPCFEQPSPSILC